jgi:hypothetical protein
MNPFRVRVRVALRLAVYRQSVRLESRRQAPWDSLPAILFSTNICFHSPYITSSLTKGWVCSLKLLLGLASAVILRSESRLIRDHILLSEFRDSSNPEGQVPVFTRISPRNRVAHLYLQALGSFSSPPTTRMATVEVFDPASIREMNPFLSARPLLWSSGNLGIRLLNARWHWNSFRTELVSRN